MVLPSNLGTAVRTDANFHGEATLAKSKMRTSDAGARTSPGQEENEMNTYAETSSFRNCLSLGKRTSALRFLELWYKLYYSQPKFYITIAK